MAHATDLVIPCAMGATEGAALLCNTYPFNDMMVHTIDSHDLCTMAADLCSNCTCGWTLTNGYKLIE